MTFARFQRVIRYALHWPLWRFYTAVAWVRLRLAGVQVGPGLRVYGWLDLEIHDYAQVVLGARVRLNSGFTNNPVGGFRRLGLWVGKAGRLYISDDVGISNATIVCMNRIYIGEHVMIGGDCKLYDTDFHPISATERLDHDPAATCPIDIGHHAFLGGHAIVLKGSEIGEGAVIGAGTVVAGKIPANEIWAGNPARFLRRVTSHQQTLPPVFDNQ